MKKVFTLILCTINFLAISQRNNYWQQDVNYKIYVTLNDTAKTLDGYLTLEYKNNAPDTLQYIWFHCWPNAYKNDRTAFSEQFLINGRTDFYFSTEEQKGYMNRLDFKVNKIPANTEDHPVHQDIIKLLLPRSLPPDSSVLIETPFHVKLPYDFSRGGYLNNTFQITQWYPKPAVYDKYGWHEMPYLDQGEFYSEYGNFDVTIDLPKKYIVAATGIKQKETIKDSIKTLQYTQDNVHDFAWFADKDFIVKEDSMQLDSKTIEVIAYYHKENSSSWEDATRYIKQAIRTKSDWIGEYPYSIVSAVESQAKGIGGMEYPTITLLENSTNKKSLDNLINHEVGHNWFYGILGSNEREHPWMDEGMNTYYDNRYESIYYPSEANTSSKIPSFIKNKIPTDIEKTALESICALKKDQPIETVSDKFSQTNYNLIAYTKTGEWMQKLENILGKKAFDSMMQAYFQQWKFKHPYPEDFKHIAEEISGNNLNEHFSLLNKKGSILDHKKKELGFTGFFNIKNTRDKHYLSLLPGFGYNFYDKFMPSVIIHNYNYPPSKFRFVASTLYGTGSGKLNGIGKLSYTPFIGNSAQQIEFSVSAASFTRDVFKDSTNENNFLRFNKIVPSVKYNFANHNPLSHLNKYIQWKTFFFKETELNFFRDTVQQLDIISYPQRNRSLNQLSFVGENDRVLYPYKYAFVAEQSKEFFRLTFTGNYYFNYEKGGGLNCRFFAGKFLYRGERNFTTQYETDRYHLNMTGTNGYEDYTYSNYFIGRNEFEGFCNRQLMIKDGGFKVRTDLLSEKIGKTEDWLAAVNFTTTIPKKYNPLEILPIKLPLRIFADFGTYADSWKQNSSTEKILYDAGLQLSLFKNTINIYLPILYSKSYSDYFKSTIIEKIFLKNISFSIDLQNISLKKYLL